MCKIPPLLLLFFRRSKQTQNDGAYREENCLYDISRLKPDLGHGLTVDVPFHEYKVVDLRVHLWRFGMTLAALLKHGWVQAFNMDEL